MKIFCAVMTSSSILTVSGPSNRACPLNKVHPSMPCRYFSTPWRALPEIASFRAFTRAMSMRTGPSRRTPNSPPRRAKVRRVGARHERLGRHAPGIDAGAAEVFAFDQRHLHAGGDEASHQWRPGLPGPDHDRIEMAGHGSHPMWLNRGTSESFMAVVPFISNAVAESRSRTPTGSPSCRLSAVRISAR